MMPVATQGREIVARASTITRYCRFVATAARYCSYKDTPKEQRLQKKVRQHVNPLTATNQQPIKLQEDWVHASYTQPSNPFLIDIGCCRGRWALQYAAQHTTMNVLGVDIRQPVIDVANSYLDKQLLSNVKFLCANINVDISRLLNDINRVSAIDTIAIQFPDPCFKKSHYKRRVVNPSFLNSLAGELRPNTRIFLQSDFRPIMEDMVDIFTSNACFSAAEAYSPHTIDSNKSICSIPTERERQCLVAGDAVYRMLYYRNGINYEHS